MGCCELMDDADSEVTENAPSAFREVAAWVESVTGDEPFLLGIGGPGGSGKTTLSQWLLTHVEGASSLPLDDFRLPREARKPGVFGSHPDAYDLGRLRSGLSSARNKEAFARPAYDDVSGRWGEPVAMSPCRMLICDGEIAAHRSLRGQFDALVVVNTHWRTQLNTRLTRDLRERKWSVEKAIEVFLESNLRDYPTYSEGAIEAANFVLYRNMRGRFSVRKRPSPDVR